MEETNKDRILNSGLYLDENDFSVNKMTEQIGGKIKTIGPLLQSLCEQGIVEKINKGNGRIAYRKTANSRTVLSAHWVSTPTSREFSPEYC